MRTRLRDPLVLNREQQRPHERFECCALFAEPAELRARVLWPQQSAVPEFDRHPLRVVRLDGVAGRAVAPARGALDEYRAEPRSVDERDDVHAWQPLARQSWRRFHRAAERAR